MTGGLDNARVGCRTVKLSHSHNRLAFQSVLGYSDFGPRKMRSGLGGY